MNGSLKTLLATLLLGVCGCSAPAQRGPSPRASAQETDLAKLLNWAELVVVGQVENQIDGRYEVRIRELISAQETISVETHPRQADGVIYVLSVVVPPVLPAHSGPPLSEFERYVFFLAPAEKAGEWLNVQSPWLAKRPATRDDLEELRRLAGSPSPASDGGEHPRGP